MDENEKKMQQQSKLNVKTEQKTTNIGENETTPSVVVDPKIGRAINPLYKNPNVATPSINAANINEQRMLNSPQVENKVTTVTVCNVVSSTPSKCPSGKRSKPYSPYTTHFAGIGPSSPTKEKTKMLNPFNRKNLLKSKRQKKTQKKKERQEKNRQNNLKKVDTIVVESSENEWSNDDEDDVIILPTIPDPVYSIDSDSDNESKYAFPSDHQTDVQMVSPINSAASDDFIGKHDQPLEDAFPGIDDDEFTFMNMSFEAMKHLDLPIQPKDTVEEEVASPKIPPFIKFVRSTEGSDNVQPLSEDVSNMEPIFAKPKETTEKSKTFEVPENCIAAVDVYESESSDMPETIYAKGNKRSISTVEQNSDSDCSDLVINTANRSKRFTKRKTSGSNKGSDYVVTDGESDNDNPVKLNEQSSDINMPYIVRGEALNNAINPEKKNSKSGNSNHKNKGEFEELSDQEFLSMLSSVVHGNSDEEDHEISTEVVEPDKTIDEVTSKQNDDNSKVAENPEINSKWTITDVIIDKCLENNKKNANNESTWKVRDEVGEVDVTDLPLDIQLNTSAPIEENVLSVDDSSIIVTEQTEPNVECVPSSSLIVHPEMGWNDEMKAFYCNSWGGETFNVKHIQSSMPNGRYEWAISEDDRYPKRIHFNKLLRCINCREMGHRTPQCYLPPREITCFMCGEKGHRDKTCPNALCLECGNKSKGFQQNCRRCANLKTIFCGLCRTLGHGPRDCPDKWRRYHSTIEPNVPLNKLLPLNKLPISRNQNKMYCCICAGNGHVAEYCRSPERRSNITIAPTKIHSYEQSYTKSENNNNSNVAPYALVSIPKQHIEFKWDINEERDRFYGRFLAGSKFKRKEVVANKPIKRQKTQLESKTAKKIKKSHLVLNPFSAAVGKSDNSANLPSKIIENVDVNTNDVQMEVVDKNAVKIVSNTQKGEQVNLSENAAEKSVQTNNIQSVVEEESSKTEAQISVENTIQDSSLKEDTTKDDILITLEKLNRIKSVNTEFSFIQAFEKLNQPKFALIFIGKNQRPFTTIVNNFPPTQSSNILNATTPKQALPLKIPVNQPNAAPKCQIPSFSQQNTHIDRITKFEDGLKMPDFIPLSTTREHNQSKYPGRSLRNIVQPNQPIVHCKATNEPSECTTSTEDNSAPISVVDLNETVEEPIEKSIENPCNAKIYLTKDHCKYLLNNKGSEFLRDETVKLNIVVNMEYGTYGNNLNIFGLPSAQDKFQKAFAVYCKQAAEDVKKKCEISARVPKNRVILMKFIKDQIIQLDKPLGNVNDLFLKMRLSERLNTKQGNKNADKARKVLNMILMGQTGLRDGEMHLVALQANLRYLKDLSKDVVSVNFRNQVFQHCRYIFSSIDHKDYPKLIHEYQALRKTNKLPVLDLDRELLGFKVDSSNSEIDVQEETAEKAVECLLPEDITLNISTNSTDSNSDIVEPVEHDNFEQAKLKLISSLKLDKSLPSTNLRPGGPESENEIAIKSEDTKNEEDISNWELNCNLILDKISLSAAPKQNTSSTFWSNMCLKVITKCLNMPKVQSSLKIKEKLEFVAKKANNSKLSYSDYLVMMKLTEA